MKRIKFAAACFLFFTGGSANAANFAVITSPPTILNIVVMITAIVCVVVGLKVVDLVRGGQLSKVWQTFIGAFVVLVLAEAALLGASFEILTLPDFVAPAMMVLSIGLFLYGLLETKRVLG